MYEITKVAQFGLNIVKKREWVRNRVVRLDKSTNQTYFHEIKAHEYLVFIGCGPDETTCYGHQTRSFGSKAEAIRYAKTTKAVDRLQYSVEVA